VALLTAVRRWRSENKVSPGVALAEVALRAARDVAERADTVRDDVRAAGRIERLEAAPDEALAAGTAAVDRARPA
jgi:hypothetical protein